LKTVWIHVLLVGAGGFLGAVLRFGLGGLIHRRFALSTFPLGTLAVNLLGCFLIGLIAGWSEGRLLLGAGLRAFALIGLLGGFTTFSAFGYETFAMFRDTEYFRAAANAVLHVAFGLVLVWAGYALSTWR